MQWSATDGWSHWGARDDNYYTSMSLEKHIYNKYWWTCVGTIVPTEKKKCGHHDLPFHKLSKGACIMVERGWCCEAAIKLRAENSMLDYYVQCTTWKDKKQVILDTSVSNREYWFLLRDSPSSDSAIIAFPIRKPLGTSILNRWLFLATLLIVCTLGRKASCSSHFFCAPTG